MHRLRMMLRGSVDSDHLQRGRSYIQELVLSTGRNDHRIALSDFLLFSRHDGFANAGGEEEDLVDAVFLLIGIVS